LTVAGMRVSIFFYEQVVFVRRVIMPDFPAVAGPAAT
jgi:hypothetical protein